MRALEQTIIVPMITHTQDRDIECLKIQITSMVNLGITGMLMTTVLMPPPNESTYLIQIQDNNMATISMVIIYHFEIISLVYSRNYIALDLGGLFG